MGIVVGLGFGGWDTAQAVHEALLVVPGDVVGGDEFDVGQLPTDGRIPERLSVSSNLTLVYWDPASLWWMAPSIG